MKCGPIEHPFSKNLRWCNDLVLLQNKIQSIIWPIFLASWQCCYPCVALDQVLETRGPHSFMIWLWYLFVLIFINVYRLSLITLHNTTKEFCKVIYQGYFRPMLFSMLGEFIDEQWHYTLRFKVSKFDFGLVHILLRVWETWHTEMLVKIMSVPTSRNVWSITIVQVCVWVQKHSSYGCVGMREVKHAAGNKSIILSPNMTQSIVTSQTLATRITRNRKWKSALIYWDTFCLCIEFGAGVCTSPITCLDLTNSVRPTQVYIQLFRTRPARMRMRWCRHVYELSMKDGVPGDSCLV